MLFVKWSKKNKKEKTSIFQQDSFEMTKEKIWDLVQ